MKNTRVLNGYRVVYMPGHPRSMKSANWLGYLYEHIDVSEKSIGRPLRDDEVVHHLDGNRSNNRHENLLVLERGQHSRLHAWLAAGAPGLKDPGEHGVNSGKSKDRELCVICGNTLQDKTKKYCSVDCARVGQRSQVPPRELLERLYSESQSMEALGRSFGVTGNAVKKWLKGYGLFLSKRIPSQAGSTLPEGVETSGEVQTS